MLEIAGSLVRWRFCRTHRLVKYEVCEGLHPISVGTKPVRASVPGSCHLREGGDPNDRSASQALDVGFGPTHTEC